jgi:vitamin B12 transporter
MRTISAIAAFVTCFASLPALAQERDTVPLTPIVVTATRSPAPRVPCPTCDARRRGLERAGISTVGEAIRSLAGVAVTQSGSFGGVTSPFLRGGQSNYTRAWTACRSTRPRSLTANVPDAQRRSHRAGARPSSVLYGSDAERRDGDSRAGLRRPT